MDTPTTNTALTRRISLLIIMVSITPLLVVSGVFAHLFHTAYRDKTLAYLEELVSKHRKSVDDHLKERMATIKTLMETSSTEDLARSEHLKELLYTLQSEYGRVFVDIGLVDENGALIAYAGPYQLDDAQYGRTEWFQSALEQNEFISDVFLGLRNLPHFIVAASRDWQGRRYILRATIDFEVFTRLVENIRIGETGHAFIINRFGEFQTQPRGDFTHCVDDLLSFVRNIFPGTPTVGPKLIVSQRESCMTGDEAVFVLATLKQGDWVLVYEQASADAFKDVNKARLIGLTVLALGAIAITLTAFFLTRRVVAYIARLDAEKEKMNEQVLHASKMASLGEMATGIAHEINNPVAIMMEEAGWIQDIMEDAKQGAPLDQPEIDRALAQIKKQGDQCKDITHKLLSFARKTEPERCILDVNSLIIETLELMASKARFANVRIKTVLAAGVPQVRVSATEMQQVLLNIVNNSLDAMETDGGELTVTTRTRDTMVELEIRDNGPGIPGSIMHKIFDPFFTTKPVGRGTGLGLAVCYGIINNIGGTIEVSSNVGQGTVFLVSLPRALESEMHCLHVKQSSGAKA